MPRSIDPSEPPRLPSPGCQPPTITSTVFQRGDLDPVARAAAGQIARRQPLGDDAFKPLGARDLEQVLARDVAERRGHVDGRRERQTEILQPVTALDVGEAYKRLTAFFE